MSKHILVVDDEEDTRDYLSAVLIENGYSVTVAENGNEGFQKAKAEKPSLVVSDIMMPEKTGIGLLQELRNDKDLKDIPIIMLSAIKRFMEQAREETNNVEILKQMETLLDNPGSKLEKFFLRFHSFRKMLLIDRDGMIEQFRKGNLPLMGIPVLPDVFLDKPVDPEEFIHAVTKLIGQAS
ncbi:response regulator transcription factor [Candidatus Magnetomonas plexicatena]|uniref:response regulator transcription factor n=1 Tax=Candidatus Magnetomonas plexicatena TaxID=2552947 RepID=UPI0010FFD2DB|nr:response regulator [Nitrospirales bacterium LBB_01]